MKFKHILPAVLLLIVVGLWIGLKSGSPTTAKFTKAGCGEGGVHVGCSHAHLFSYDPAILDQNESHTKKRLFTKIPVDQNSTKLIRSVNNDSDWKGQIGGAIRARQITISPQFRNKKPFQKGEVLTLNLFDDVSIDTVVYESFPNVNETISTTTRVANTMFGRAVMAFTDNELRVKVILPESNKIYEIQYNHDDGNHYVLEMDPAIVDKDDCGTVEGSRFANPPKAASEEVEQSGENHSPPLVASDEGVALVVIDNLVVYPENVVAAAGSEANLQNIAAQGIALANDAHITTNTGMYINLIHSARLTGYTDTGNQNTDLDRVTNLSDGYIDEVHTWRDTYGADFVHMMHSVGGGLGWRPNFASTSSGRPDLGFSVTGWNSFASFTPAHELGHNMNLSHSKFQSSNVGNPTDPTGTDAAGWHWHPNGDPAVSGNCSVMSYTAYTGEAGHAKVGLFSDPNIVHNGQPAGDITHANAARVLRAYKNIYASYRTRPLAANSILVESPNGGEVLSRGQTVEIRWNSNTVVGDVKIDLYKGGTFEREITAGTINDRIYYYTIPNDLPSSNLYKLRISSVNTPAIEDFSDVNFTITQPIYTTNLNTDPGFTMTGSFQYGVPSGNNRPATAYTGSNIYDTTLGDSSFNAGTLKTFAIDCSNYTGVTLDFWGHIFTTSTVKFEVSNNNTSWTELQSITDSTSNKWVNYKYDISTVANGQSTVYVRWSMTSTGSQYTGGGLGIDDVSITGVISATEPLISASVASLAPTTLIGNNPVNQNFTVRNAGIGTLNYSISDNQSWLSVSPSSGTSTGEEDTITVTYSTTGLAQGNYSATITISDNAAGNSPVTIPVSLSVTLPPIYFANMDTNPGWTLQGAWAWGVPQGAGGDPNSGFTGANVIAFNLSGAYANNLPETHATTPVIDCSNYSNVQLSFYRWLGVESGNFDKAYVRVSTDNSTWTNVFAHNTSAHATVQDTAWSKYTYDISAIADGKPTVYVRWTMGITDGSVVHSGWNLDDVKVDGDFTGYIVSYDGNGNTGGTAPGYQTKIQDVALTLATNSGNLVKTGHAFAGWNTAADGTGINYSPGGVYAANSALVLYAKWTYTFAGWAGSTFENAFTDTNLTSDPDGDGLTNLQEFAFGMDPTSSTMRPLAFDVGGEVTQAGVPVLRFATSKYHAVFGRRKDYVAAGLTYTADFSADLKVWDSVDSGLGAVLTGAGTSEVEAVSIEFPATVPVDGGGNAAPKFFRVGVSSN